MDWLEKFRERCDVEQIWVRCFCEAEEFPLQRLSKIGNVVGMIPPLEHLRDCVGVD